MKRILAAVLIAALCVTLCLTLCACDAPEVRVESVLNIDREFKGMRKVRVVFPLNADVDAVKDALLEDAPTADLEGADFTYTGAAGDGYSFELTLSFKNKQQYEEQVAAVIGRDANAVLSVRDTVMFSGTRMAEDFDVSDLIGWIVRDTTSTEQTKEYTFAYFYNQVTVGSDTYDTGSTVSVSEGSGIPINSVEVKTYNEKSSLFGRTFDRSFVFSFPSDNFSANRRTIDSYFGELVGENTLISDMHEGNSVLYTVTFEGLDLSELETVTAKVLDSDSISIYYGDKENMSTPLFEGRVLEEALDTLSFCSPSGEPPAVKYTYTLPTNAVRGEGAVYEDGGWVSTGTWDDGAYRLEDASGMTHLRIYDGRQYYVSGVDFTLESLGKQQFRRTTAFLYPGKDGFEGPVYATKFYQAKQATAEYDTDGEYIICSIICEGTIAEINEELERIFGAGNYLSYEQNSGALSDKTVCTDYIDLREILSAENAQIPMTYIASAEHGESIVTMMNGGIETAYRGKNNTKLELTGGIATVGYHGVIPKAGNILLYLVLGGILTAVTVLIAARLMYQPIRRERAAAMQPAGLLPEHSSAQSTPEEKDNTPSYAPTQTTTFSIFELGVLSRNKKYVEEINKDVENRLHADRIEERKKELRQKELEEMERKVYGGDEQPEEEAPADDAPRTVEILETFDKAAKNEPQPEEPVDPIELLDLMSGEDADDQGSHI